VACGNDDTVAPPLDLRTAVTATDRAFIVEMARHACVIEDWPLPEADSEDVDSLLPGDADFAIIAADPDTGTDVGAVWTFDHHPPLMTLDGGNAVPEVAIAVTPDRRGRGVGAALLDALIDRCIGMHPALALNVHRRNPARRLYQRKGFRAAGPGRGDLGMAMVIELAALPPLVDSGSMAYRPMAYAMTTDRLRLDLRNEADAEWNCELLAEHANPTPNNVPDMRRRLGEQRNRAWQTGIGLLTIRRRSDDRPLGYCGLIVGHCTMDEPEIVIELLRRYHGQGYATEAAHAVTDAAFATGRTRIWATVASWNAPSLAGCRRLGFREHHRVPDDDGGETIHLVRDRELPAQANLPRHD
jgi:RimJ/RimL family protein N-acetyltransferase